MLYQQLPPDFYSWHTGLYLIHNICIKTLSVDHCTGCDSGTQSGKAPGIWTIVGSRDRKEEFESCMSSVLSQLKQLM